MQNKVENKKQVGNGTILETMQIVVTHINPIDGSSEAHLEKALVETRKLLKVQVQPNGRTG